MTKAELYYRMTGTETPLFITDREEIIFSKCLSIINLLEEDIENLQNHYLQYCNGPL